MRIGVNARFLHSEILEGIGRYTWETVRRMVIDHPEDQFYFFFDRAFPKKYLFAPNIIPIIVSPQARHPFLFWYWFEVALPKAVEKKSLDVFYSPDNFLSLTLSIPTLLVVHDLAYLYYPEHIPYMARQYYKYFMPKYIAKADQIITVSEYVKKDIYNNFSNSQGKITVAHNAGVEVDLTSGYNNDDLYFIYVGSLNPRKNINLLLEAFEDFHSSHDNFKLVLVGKKFNLSNDTLSKLENLIQKGLVEHKSNVADADLKDLMLSSFGLVYVSLFEGFGIPILEAMSFGVPVITSNVTSMPEVAGDAAILVDPNNYKEISDAMTLLVEDPFLKEKLIERGFKRIKHFSWQKTSEIIYNRLRKLSKK